MMNHIPDLVADPILWSSVPVIDLDEFNGDQQQPSIEREEFVTHKNFMKYLERRRFELLEKENESKEPHKNFMKVVERRFELLEKDFVIERFRLQMRYPGGAHDGKINEWLRIALKGKMLQELDLRLVINISYEESDGERRLYLAPDILRTTKSLTILKMDNVIINPGSIKLPSLKTMSLKNVEFRTGSSSKTCRLLSGLPSIEDLFLSKCTCEIDKKIELSSPSLKSLQLMGLTPTIITKLEAVNLEALSIHSHANNIPFMKPDKYWQKLRTLEFGHVVDLEDYWFQDLDSRAPLLESLTLHGCQQRDKLDIRIQHLKCFVLFSKAYSSIENRLSTDFPNLLEAVIILETKADTSWGRFFRLKALENIRCCSTKTSVRLHVRDAKDLLCPAYERTRYPPPPFPNLENLEVHISSSIPEKDIVPLMDSLYWMAPSVKSPSVKQNSSEVLLDYRRRKYWK